MMTNVKIEQWKEISDAINKSKKELSCLRNVLTVNKFDATHRQTIVKIIEKLNTLRTKFDNIVCKEFPDDEEAESLF